MSPQQNFLETTLPVTPDCHPCHIPHLLSDLLTSKKAGTGTHPMLEAGQSYTCMQVFSFLSPTICAGVRDIYANRHITEKCGGMVKWPWTENQPLLVAVHSYPISKFLASKVHPSAVYLRRTHTHMQTHTQWINIETKSNGPGDQTTHSVLSMLKFLHGCTKRIQFVYRYNKIS